MVRAGVVVALLGCSEPQHPLSGTWRGTATGDGPSRSVTITIASEAKDGSILAPGGLLCSTAFVGGSLPSVSVEFTDCLSAPAHPVVIFQGSLSGNVLSGTLTGWEFSGTAISLNRQ